MARTERIPDRWTVGPYEFQAVENHGFPEPEYPPVMYRFKIDGVSNSELYRTLDRAIVSAIGQKHTGPRMASGGGTGTAADWFCVMVGLDHVENGEAQRRYSAALTVAAGTLTGFCEYAQAHTREFCGNADCRES